MKLVRDLIPKMFPEHRYRGTKSHEEHVRLVAAKLVEEACEFQVDGTIDELADVVEVVQAALKVNGWTDNMLEEVRAKKARLRGGFSDGSVIISDLLVAPVLPALTACPFEIYFVGSCGVAGTPYCPKHDVLCANNCGRHAEKDCENQRGLMCGGPICKTCGEHKDCWITK